MKTLLAVMARHPYWTIFEIVGWCVVGYLIAAVLLDAWAEREEQRRDKERERLDKIIQANTPPRDWPTRPGPKGRAA